MTRRQARIIMGFVCCFAAGWVVPAQLHSVLALTLGVAGTMMLFWE